MTDDTRDACIRALLEWTQDHLGSIERETIDARIKALLRRIQAEDVAPPEAR